MNRRLTTILAADLAGYSRLVAIDEELVIERLRAIRKDVLDPVIAHGQGRMIKTMGDGFLVEFASPVEAIRAAVAIQQQMARNQADVPHEHRLRFRIGVNLGDVLIDGDDVLGDCVNVAARLEAMAPVGGICLARSVHDHARGRIEVPMTAMGPQVLKNIPEPVEVWRIDIEQAEPSPASSVSVVRPGEHGDRPSVAVLPFESLSADPDQAFLADGLVDDIIMALSRFRWLFVISRKSTGVYAGRSADVRTIAGELHARYIVEGSVRRAGDRLRVSVKLTDGETAGQVLADRFDRSMTDLFDLQDELTLAITSALVPEIGGYERARSRRKPAANLNAWELYQRASGEFFTYDRERMKEARSLALKAVEADPEMASAYALLTRIGCSEYLNSAVENPERSRDEALDWAERALACDPRSDDAHNAHGLALLLANRTSEAIRAFERGIALNVNNADLRIHMAMALMNPGIERSNEALGHAETAIELSPADPFLWTFHTVACIASMQSGDIERARHYLALFRGVPQVDWKCLLTGAVCDVMSGDMAGAAELVALAKRRASPVEPTLALARRALPAVFAVDRLANPVRRLREAGLPDA